MLHALNNYFGKSRRGTKTISHAIAVLVRITYERLLPHSKKVSSLLHAWSLIIGSNCQIYTFPFLFLIYNYTIRSLVQFLPNISAQLIIIYPLRFYFL